MPQFFPRTANSIVRLILLAVVLGVALVAWLGELIVRSSYETLQNVPRSQPVPFSHEHHVGGLGIDCRYCHTTVERAAKAAVPPAATCMNCHSQVKKDSPLLKPLRESWAKGTPVQWVRVHKSPDYVYFPHNRHVTSGVGCVECHGRIDQMVRVRQSQPLSMGWCLECHRDPAPHMRPVDKITTMDWEPPNGESRESFGAKIVQEKKIAPPTDCSRCHR
jgi:hypothetical protein